MQQTDWITIEREYYANRRTLREIAQMFGVSIPYLNEQIRLNRWQRKQPEQVRREELRDMVALKEAFRIKEEMESSRVENMKREYALELAKVEEEVQRLIELDISFV